MPRGAVIPAALLFLGALAAPLHAQKPDTSNTVASVLRRAAFERWQVRLTAVDSAVIQGRVWAVEGDSARVGDLRLPPSSVLMIERMHRDNSGLMRGALIGGAVLGGAFAVFSSAMCEGNCSTGTGTAVAVAAGAFMAGTLGGMLDPGDPSWRVVWRKNVDSSLRSE